MTPQTSPSSPPLPVRAWLARTFHGLSWKRLGIFLAIVALPTAGHVISRSFMPDKTLAVTAMVAPMFFTHLTVFFGAVWIVVVVASNWAPARTGPRVLALAAAVLVGLILGNLANNIIDPLLFPPMKDPSTLLKEISAVMLWSHVIVAGVLGYYFLLREEEVAASLHREQMRRIDLDRELAEARLQLMQAQIEPHFLFNALANVRRLYQTDAPSARAMLDQLSRYLGAMLPRMRSTESTLGQELALALAYLHVQKIRMGARLTVVSAVPESLQSLPFPPMMLVTLVENAIRHGVSPLPQGGEVRIAATHADGRLRVQVSDTGRGLAESSGSGVGLANISARLATLYGTGAQLLLAENAAGGVTATLDLPTPAVVPEVEPA
jgi:signal transduction histidine kinase